MLKVLSRVWERAEPRRDGKLFTFSLSGNKQPPMSDDIDMAIAATYDTRRSQQDREEAIHYLNNLLSSDSEAWKSFVTKLFQTHSLETVFYCINVIIDTVNHQ